MSGNLPTTLPTSTTCYCFEAPDDSEWREWIWGAFLSLCEPSRWNDNGDETCTPEEGSAVFLEVFHSIMACNGVPTGAILEWPSENDIPEGYLECLGQELWVSHYHDLYVAIGNTWGGDEQKFNLPDKRNRATIGGGSDYSIGDTTGEKTVTLTEAQMPTHWHYVPSVTFGPVQAGVGAMGLVLVPTANYYTGEAGGGGSHNNVPPSIASRYMIKTGK